MNKILVANGLLLISLMGLQQWFDCYCKQNAGQNTFIESLGWSTRCFFEHLLPLAPTSENYFYFAIVSLLIPLIAVLSAKSLSLGKREIAILVIVNPLLYSALGYIYQPGFDTHVWTWNQLAGPTVIGEKAVRADLFKILSTESLALEEKLFHNKKDQS